MSESLELSISLTDVGLKIATSGTKIGPGRTWFVALRLGKELGSAVIPFAENFEGWRLAVRDLLDDAADRFPHDVDRNRLATFILTTMEGAVMQARAYESLEPFDSSVAMLRDYFDRLLVSARSYTQIKGES